MNKGSLYRMIHSATVVIFQGRAQHALAIFNYRGEKSRYENPENTSLTAYNYTDSNTDNIPDSKSSRKRKAQ